MRKKYHSVTGMLYDIKSPIAKMVDKKIQQKRVKGIKGIKLKIEKIEKLLLEIKSILNG